MDRVRKLFDFEGRLSRLGFWRAYLTIAILLAGFWITGLLALMVVGSLGAILLAPIALLPVALAAISVRRLHDRGKSGWWAVAFVVVPQLVSLDVAAEAPRASPPALLALLSLAASLIGLWGWIEIGFRKGTSGPNRYGDDPVSPSRDAFA